MSRNTRSNRLIGAVAALLVPAMAVAAPDGDDSGRYSMSPSEGGFVRLDKQTGAMSFCTRKDGNWKCEPMADGESVVREENSKLSAENKALAAEKKHLEEMLGLDGNAEGAKPDTGAGPGGSVQVPTEEDVDKMFDYLEGMVKKFKDRIKKLEEKTGKGEPL